MPITAGAPGTLDDHQAALAALDATIGVEPSAEMAEMPGQLAAAREPYARYLGFLRAEVAKLLH
jgi:hypothetical protein